MERRAGGKEKQREREKQGERGRAGEEHCEDREKILYLVSQVTGVE